MEQNPFQGAVKAQQDLNAGTNVSTAANISFSSDDLNGIQLERYYSLLSLYNEERALKIASSVNSHGFNSWAMVSDKVMMITDTDAELQTYYDQIDSIISIGKLHSIGEIIQAVAMVRRLLGLKPHLKNILKSCVTDFLARHMATQELSVLPEGSNDKPKVIGYIPTFNLNCQL